MKKCGVCKQEKDESQFNKDNRGAGGLSYRCKACKSAADAEYRKEHRDEILLRDKAYYENNKEVFLAKCAEYNKTHKDHKSQYDKAYREANSEKKRRRDKAYYEAHKAERLAKQKIYMAKKREKVREQYKNFVNTEEPIPIPEFAMGVYQIRNVISGKVYIGSTVLFTDRKAAHFKELRAGTHHSPRLQAAFNKYGENAFVFEPIEIVDHEDKLLEREQHYLDTVKPFGRSGYNISKLAGEPGNRGKAAIKTFSFQDKNGKVITVTNLAKWCREHKIDDNRMRAMLRGKILTWKGYARVGYVQEKAINTKYEFISPDGVLHVVSDGFYKWCSEHGLNQNLMRAVHRGAMDNHKGWTRLSKSEDSYVCNG